MFWKLDRITKDISFIHFSLMFGYKMFSLYFPLFMLERNFSITQIGYATFLIYLPISLTAPFVGFLNHKINPAFLTALGILGYGLYCLGMIFFPNFFVFCLMQILLGVSSALFFVSSRAILMGSNLKNPARTFAWFYAAPSYADAIAPAIGAFLIWQSGFTGAFAAGVVIQVFTSIFCLLRLRKTAAPLTEQITVVDSIKNYGQLTEKMKEKKVFPLILISFLILILAGFVNTFFVLYLKDLGWSRNMILLFNSVSAVVFMPISLFAIKLIAGMGSKKNISLGSRIMGLFLIMIGIMGNMLNFYYIFLLMLGASAGGLMTSAGRSGLMTTKMKQFPEESAAVDTVFSPVATALGGLAGGFAIVALGYPVIFMAGGAVIFLAGVLTKK